MDNQGKHDMFSTLVSFFIVFEKEVLDYLPGNNDPQLSPMLYRALHYIYMDQVMVPTRLSNRLAIPATNASRIIKRLVELGYIEKTRDLHDKRIAHLTMTDRGTELIENSYQALENALYEKFKVLTSAELKQMMDSFTVCRDYLLRIGDAKDREQG